jgi:hypothetical protein
MCVIVEPWYQIVYRSIAWPRRRASSAGRSGGIVGELFLVERVRERHGDAVTRQLQRLLALLSA